MKWSKAIAVGVFCGAMVMSAATKSSIAADDDLSLLNADRAVFAFGAGSDIWNDHILDPNFTWTDSDGVTRSKSEVVHAFRPGKGPTQAETGGRGDNSNPVDTTSVHTHGQVGVIQEKSGSLYILRIWVKQPAGWRAVLYQAVLTGASLSGEPGKGDCENPCKSVPFHPQNKDERDVITAYQEVERAVVAHNSAAWGVHIADEFFAVTSNSDRPLDKATRMAGLDNQKVAGIAPFPLVSARMFEFGETMVMVSRQQPEHGLPLHVTRVWFKRNGTWVEAYSYQTTIQADRPQFVGRKGQD